MKQKILPKLLLVATLLLCSLYASAYDFSAVNEDDVLIFYNILSEDDLTCEVTGRYYNSSSNKDSYEGEVVIPETTTYLGKTYSVVAIGSYAFYYCSSLTSVTIPNSLTTIGENAFWNCTGLTSVTIGNSVITIGYCAFWDCTNLTGELIIPDSVTIIGRRAFEGCTGLTSLTLGNSVTEIGEQTFEFCI